METLKGDLCDFDMVNLEESTPASSFESLSTLKVVNLSRTNIQSLPPSVYELIALVRLTLKECSMLTELPPEIGRLKNLEVFDLEGTEIMYLPREMGNLKSLQCLRVSLCTNADEYKDTNGIKNIIPRTLIANLKKLEELSIGVNPYAKWWEVELVEAILGNLHMLSNLKTLKLYFPTAKELQYLLRRENNQPPMYSRLSDFRLKVGHREQLASSVPSKLMESFDQLEKCLKYENGEASIDEIEGLIEHANALFICRHWTLTKLSKFSIDRLKYCLVAECNEMHTIIDADDVYGKGSSNDKKYAFESLEYLAIHSMKNLHSIWKGTIRGNSFVLLQILALHTCPELTTVFNKGVLTQLNRLTVLIVEDCPKVKSLVSREHAFTRKSYGPFLPNLRNILLLDLPELTSISSGVCIAPQLDTLLVFNCLKLGDLNHAGLSNDVRMIKGETEWWDALNGRQSQYSRAFVPLIRDGNLMNLLSEDTNSLNQFCKLQCQGEASFTSSSSLILLDSQLLPDQQQKTEPPRIITPGNKGSRSNETGGTSFASSFDLQVVPDQPNKEPPRTMLDRMKAVWPDEKAHWSSSMASKIRISPAVSPFPSAGRWERENEPLMSSDLNLNFRYNEEENDKGETKVMLELPETINMVLEVNDLVIIDNMKPFDMYDISRDKVKSIDNNLSYPWVTFESNNAFLPETPVANYFSNPWSAFRSDMQDDSFLPFFSWDKETSVDNNLSNPFSTFECIMQEHFKSTYQSTMTVHSEFLQLLDDYYFIRTTMSPKLISDLQSIAVTVNSTGNINRCVEIYISQRKNILQRFKPSTFEIEFRDGTQKFEWKILESLIQDWIKLVKICLDYSLFAKEKQLCEQIFEGLETTIDDILYMVIIQDYEIHVSNIVYAMSLSNPPPDKLFLILDLYETLDRFLSVMCVVMKPKDPGFGTLLFPVLTNYITNSLSMFETVLLYHQSSVIFVGPVDPLPEYVMSYLCQLCDNKKAMMKLSLQALPTVDMDDVTNLNYEEFKGQSDMSCHVIWIIMILVSNLESGAKLCEDGSAGHFFAMKNIGYVVQKIQGHWELMEVVGDGYLGKLIQKLNLIKLKYLMLEIEKMRDMRNYSVMV